MICYVVRFPNLPCVTRPTQNAQFPLEVLDVVPCVRKKITDDQKVKMIKQTARPAKEREEDIKSWVRYLLIFLGIYVYLTCLCFD